jgi:hypothetical protein
MGLVAAAAAAPIEYYFVVSAHQRVPENSSELIFYSQVQYFTTL